jgi:hypothetical protein
MVNFQRKLGFILLVALCLVIGNICKECQNKNNLLLSRCSVTELPCSPVSYCAYKTLLDQISDHPHPLVSKLADPTPSAPLLKAITMNVMVEV